MSQRAHVTSTEAIESFRTRLIVYLSKARPIVEDACDDVVRTREWLQSDRRLHWENQVRRRMRELEYARQALHTVQLANLREASSAEQAAVQRAKRALNLAEEKLVLVKRWTMQFDHRVGPLVKQLDQLRTMLAHDTPKAVAHLAQLLKVIEAYTGVVPPPAGGAAPSSASSRSEGRDAGMPTLPETPEESS